MILTGSVFLDKWKEYNLLASQWIQILEVETKFYYAEDYSKLCSELNSESEQMKPLCL